MGHKYFWGEIRELRFFVTSSEFFADQINLYT